VSTSAANIVRKRKYRRLERVDALMMVGKACDLFFARRGSTKEPTVFRRSIQKETTNENV
jgi:hypothetical protein